MATRGSEGSDLMEIAAVGGWKWLRLATPGGERNLDQAKRKEIAFLRVERREGAKKKTRLVQPGVSKGREKELYSSILRSLRGTCSHELKPPRGGRRKNKQQGKVSKRCQEHPTLGRKKGRDSLESIGPFEGRPLNAPPATEERRGPEQKVKFRLHPESGRRAGA